MNYQEAKDELISLLTSAETETAQEHESLMQFAETIQEDAYTEESIIALCLAKQEWQTRGSKWHLIFNILHDLRGWFYEDEFFEPRCSRFFKDVPVKEEEL